MHLNVTTVRMDPEVYHSPEFSITYILLKYSLMFMMCPYLKMISIRGWFPLHDNPISAFKPFLLISRCKHRRELLCIGHWLAKLRIATRVSSSTLTSRRDVYLWEAFASRFFGSLLPILAFSIFYRMFCLYVISILWIFSFLFIEPTLYNC